MKKLQMSDPLSASISDIVDHLLPHLDIKDYYITQGMRAFDNGIDFESNPYVYDPLEAGYYWELGWVIANDEWIEGGDEYYG